MAASLSKKQPIGIFDSGVGGLTVVHELSRLLPHEDIVYFGDTARVPYGTKSEKMVKMYAQENSSFLRTQKVKMIVVACNTASAVALPTLEQQLPIPVIGVVGPGARAAAFTTRTGNIGVIGTPRTVVSGVYETEMKRHNAQLHIIQQACPLFVPLAEEGWIDHDATVLIVEEYLAPLKGHGLDTLVLGCTHYPILTDIISKTIGAGVTLVNSAEATAREVQVCLSELGLLNNAKEFGTLKVFVSDVPYHFKKVGERFLGRPLDAITQVDLDAINLGLDA